ncbi:MAG: 16S rRNA (cytosine(967)-C(5))-methyltransferase RsmB [Eubacteriales bacterium]|nr:16S rRNA (cytosine(967)-C(5))-methyltransferase RsmB [Eubacteriales bacterium]
MDLNRKTAYDTLLEIEKNEAYSNIELNKQIKLSSPDSPAFVRELVYGVTENRIQLDYILDFLIPRGIKKVKKQDLTLLRMGIYQLKWMNSVPEYAAVNETVKMAKKFCRGREGFINGVLRGYLKKKDEINLPNRDENIEKYLSVKYSFALWIVKLFIKDYGVCEAEKILAASNMSPKLTIRVNLLKNTREQMKLMLEEKGFSVEESLLSERILIVKGSGLLDTEFYKKGYFSVQDEASVLAAETLNPKPFEKVYDICAAPGGKTLAMAEIMEDKGEILAFDIFPHKLNLIDKAAKRLSLTCIKTFIGDGEVFKSELVSTADKVLVDAPCSGLGVIIKKPEIKYKEITDDCVGLSMKQLHILENASKYVKTGGQLVYSTCTINKIENNNVIEKFLEKNSNYSMTYMKQFLPNIDGTDGFFICKLKKELD